MSINDQRIAFIGCGNMAKSLIGGLVKDGHAPNSIIASSPSTDDLNSAEKIFNIVTTADNRDCIKDAAIIVLAVKPQILKQVIEEIAGYIQPQQLILSIAAAISEKNLQHWLGNKNQPIVRAMPNMAALINCSASLLYANHFVNEELKSSAESLMRAVGMVLWVENEITLDQITAISGSGPAYFFYFMELMAAKAEQYGLNAEAARLIVIQTCLGSARLALESSKNLKELRENVTSPGGITEEVLAVFKEQNFEKIFMDALEAGRKKSEILNRMHEE